MMNSVQENVTNLPNFECILTLNGHLRGVTNVQFSSDGRWLASSSADKTIIVWEFSNGEQYKTLTGHTMGISDVSWSSDNKYLCSASDDMTVRIWELSTGICLKELRHESWVFCCSFDPKSQYIASGAYDEVLRVWDVKSSRLVHQIRAHSDPISSVSFNRDGSTVIAGSQDGMIRLWDTTEGRCLDSFEPNSRHPSKDKPPVSFVKFSPNGSILVGTLDSKLRLYKYDKGFKCLKTYKGHKNDSFCLFSTFSNSNEHKWIFSGSEDHLIYIWDMKTKAILQTLSGHTDTVMAVSCHPTQMVIASCGLENDKTVKIWKHFPRHNTN